MTVTVPGSFHTITLPTDKANVRKARTDSATALRSWDVPTSVIDDALLIVSELVTNAIRHTFSAEFRLALHLDGVSLRIAVHDDSTRTRPTRVPTGDDAEWGRGLGLIASMCSHWGTEQVQDGKDVWAVLTIPTTVPPHTPHKEEEHPPIHKEGAPQNFIPMARGRSDDDCTATAPDRTAPVLV